MDLSRRHALKLGGAAAAALPLATLGGRRASAAQSNLLQPGQALLPGQRLYAPGGQYFLTLQGDGNLVVYGSRALWSTGTQGTSPGQLVMQGDGNLVLYDAGGRPRWASDTWGGTGRAGAFVQVQDDANVVVCNVTQPLWSWQSGKIPFPVNHPNSLRNIGNAFQVVVAAGDSPGATTGSLSTWQYDPRTGVWGNAYGTMPIRSGYAGWKWGGARVQGDGSSPAGTYTLTAAYGLASSAPLGSGIPYLPVSPNAYRSGDPRDPQTYNITQPVASASRTWRADTNNSERYGDYPTQYQYLLNIDFCTPPQASITHDAAHDEWVTSQPAPVGRGFAIYLHINGAGSTAGCVSLPANYLAQVMAWLAIGQNPRIVMAPTAWLPSA